MALYGFNSNSDNDRLAITNILANSHNISTHEFDSLAQYKIRGIELVPTSVEMNMPRQWGLNVMTSLEGFNSYDGNPVWFKDVESADSCITYELSTTDFVKMLNAGLYIDPSSFLVKLQEEFVGKSFYRKTRVQLIQCQVLDTSGRISAGDLSQKDLKGTNFYIGSDLDTYAIITPELQSNFTAELTTVLDTLVKNPILTRSEKSLDSYRDLNVSHEVEMLLEQLGLNQRVRENESENYLNPVSLTDPIQQVTQESEVESVVNSQVELPDLTDLVEESTVKSQELSQASIGSDNVDMVKSQDVVDDVAQTQQTTTDFYNIDELMDKISSISSNTQRKRKQRVYVDDFAKALADSKAQSQKVKQDIRQENTKKNVDKDNGLEL